MNLREERDAWEDAHLAPYAVKSQHSRGRHYTEARHAYRSEFQRDRDRIIYCKSFRRLEYKTQVFVNGMADHYRTRLTHTLEMTAIARTLARALLVNEDLAEAIALAHDIGHSPYGHSGERMLDELMADAGGFDHNLQSCRAVEVLESLYPHFVGLNLTWEVRAGLRKHAGDGAALDGWSLGPWQFVEGQIADIADDIGYQAHDVDDGLEAGLIREEDLNELVVWQLARERARERAGGELPDYCRITATVRALLDLQVDDVISGSRERLQRYKPADFAAVMAAPERLVCFSEELRPGLEVLRNYLSDNLYFHPKVVAANREAARMMQELFHFYCGHAETMGRKAQARLATHGLKRTVCDYIAGMTDRYAMDEYERLVLGK